MNVFKLVSNQVHIDRVNKVKVNITAFASHKSVQSVCRELKEKLINKYLIALCARSLCSTACALRGGFEFDCLPAAACLHFEHTAQSVCVDGIKQIGKYQFYKLKWSCCEYKMGFLRPEREKYIFQLSIVYCFVDACLFVKHMFGRF